MTQLRLSRRVCKLLDANGIATIEMLTKKSLHELKKLKNFGKGAANEILRELEKHKLSLAPDTHIENGKVLWPSIEDKKEHISQEKFNPPTI